MAYANRRKLWQSAHPTQPRDHANLRKTGLRTFPSLRVVSAGLRTTQILQTRGDSGRHCCSDFAYCAQVWASLRRLAHARGPGLRKLAGFAGLAQVCAGLSGIEWDLLGLNGIEWDCAYAKGCGNRGESGDANPAGLSVRPCRMTGAYGNPRRPAQTSAAGRGSRQNNWGFHA